MIFFFLSLDGGSGELPEGELSPFCIFAAQENIADIKKHVEVFNLLIRRYRYPFSFLFPSFHLFRAHSFVVFSL